MSAAVRATGALAAAAVLGLVTVPAAQAADVDAVNTETVQVYLSADGDVESRRVYEQLTLTGSGRVELANPVAGTGLRNLDGFGGYPVEHGRQIVETTVDGSEHVRTVSDYAGTLPVTITPRYELDGKVVSPGDLVGRSGHLVATYTVANRTSKPRTVTVEDGTGKRVTRTVEVPVPMVGQLATVLPKGFTRVQPNGASTAGDGKGGTRLSYTMTLFPPLGSATAELTYEADVRDAVVPQVDVSLLPIDPFANPTVKKAADSYDSGAGTGAELVAGAGEIDTNLLKLRDGASELLSGLQRLSAGADELSAGLGDEAGPGSSQLADGAGQLDDGLGRLDDGAGRLRDGAGRLSDGAGRLAEGTGSARAGSEALSDGLSRISGGLNTLAERLPAAPEGVRQLIAGVDQIRAGLGDPSKDGTLLNGLTRLAAGADQLRGGLAQLQPGLATARGGVDQVQAGLADATKAGGSLDQLIGGLNLVKSLCGVACGPVVDQLIGAATNSKTQLTAANLGLLQVSAGLGNAVAALDPATGPLGVGAARLSAGLQDALTGATKLAGGTTQVREGLVTLKTKLTEAVAGVLQLSSGAGTAYDGSLDLADGLGQLDAGAGELAGGADQLAGGARELSGGAGTAKGGSARLAAGARKLAEGLADAAKGSGLIAEGLRTAAKGAPQLVDGAGRLSKEGMGALKEAGTETAVDYGTLAATIKVASERAVEDGMAYGAPEGARGLTAYSFILQGADGEAARNWTRGLGAAVLLGLGGLVAVRRRLA